MKDNLPKIVPGINRALEEAEKQIRRRQMEEKLEKNTEETERPQTDSAGTAGPDFS